jgi:beta-glucuronidase
MTWARILSDMQIIDGLNANFIRTAHYPNHISTYIILDRLGLLAAVEVPMWQATEVEYEVQAERRIADQMWREMILSNRNRPSIIMWSSNNESREVEARATYIVRLLDDFRANYPDRRLVTQSAAADRGGPGDPSQSPLDVAGWTMYFGIFHGSTYYQGTADFLAAAHAAFPETPIINTEFGIWSAGDSNERRQAEVLTETLRALTDVSAWDAQGDFNPDGYIAGMTWWAAFDWYTAHTRLQTMGVYKMDRSRAKLSADLLREAYAVWNPLRH